MLVYFTVHTGKQRVLCEKSTLLAGRALRKRQNALSEKTKRHFGSRVINFVFRNIVNDFAHLHITKRQKDKNP